MERPQKIFTRINHMAFRIQRQPWVNTMMVHPHVTWRLLGTSSLEGAVKHVQSSATASSTPPPLTVTPSRGARARLLNLSDQTRNTTCSDSHKQWQTNNSWHSIHYVHQPKSAVHANPATLWHSFRPQTIGISIIFLLPRRGNVAPEKSTNHKIADVRFCMLITVEDAEMLVLRRGNDKAFRSGKRSVESYCARQLSWHGDFG